MIETFGTGVLVAATSFLLGVLLANGSSLQSHLNAQRGSRRERR
jgi:hypothetical protein